MRLGYTAFEANHCTPTIATPSYPFITPFSPFKGDQLDRLGPVWDLPPHGLERIQLPLSPPSPLIQRQRVVAGGQAVVGRNGSGCSAGCIDTQIRRGPVLVNFIMGVALLISQIDAQGPARDVSSPSPFPWLVWQFNWASGLTAHSDCSQCPACECAYAYARHHGPRGFISPSPSSRGHTWANQETRELPHLPTTQPI